MEIADPPSTNSISIVASEREAGSGVDSAPDDSLLIRHALEDFNLFNRAARLSQRTQEFYRCQLRPFLLWCADVDVHAVQRIMPAHLRAYIVHLQNRNLSDYTVHAAARAIRAFLNFCVRKDYLPSSPMAKVAMPRIDKRTLPSLSEQQVRRLMRKCDSRRDRAIIVFLLGTGCRVSKLVNLKGADVDLDSGEVRIHKCNGR